MRTVIILMLSTLLLFDSVMAEEISSSAKLKYYTSKIEENRESLDKILSFYDSVICIHRDDGNVEFTVKYMMDKAKLTAINGEYAKAFHTYSDALDAINSKGELDKNETAEKIDCTQQIARMALNLGMYDESTAYFFDMLEYNNYHDINYTVRAYSMLGLIFLNINKMETAADYLNKAKKIVKEVDTLNNHSIFSFYCSYAGLFYFKAEYDNAIKYLSMAEDYCKKLDDKEMMNNVYQNFAIIYQGLEEFDIAEDYFMRILELTGGDDLSYLHALALQNIAFLYKEQGKKSAALTYYDKALSISTKIKANKIKASVLIEMSDIFYENGDYKKSRDYLEKGRILKDSIFNTQNMDRIMILTNKYETRNEKIEKELLEKTLLASELANKNKTIVLSVLGGVFVLFMIVVFVSIYKMIVQRKANKMLNDTIAELQQKTQMDIESSKHEMKTTIDDKNRELTSTALGLIKANEMLSTLKDEVRKLVSSNKEAERENIIKDISIVLNSYSPEQGWTEFRLYFEQVHQSFFTSLTEQHPNLTHGEHRICALLVLNMSAKEIATITNRSTRTIESLIYRIRLKLNLPAETKTICYLRQFM